MRLNDERRSNHLIQFFCVHLRPVPYVSSLFPTYLHRSQEPLRLEHHHGDEGRTEGEHPVILELPEDFGQRDQQERAQDDARYAAHAAEDDHAEDQDRLGKGEALGRDESHLRGEKNAGSAGPGRADDKGQELETERIDAHGFRGYLVLANRDPGPSDAGGHQPVHGKNGKDRYHENEVIEVESAAEPVTGERRPADLRNAIRTSGDAVPIVENDTGDLSEAKGDDGEIVSAEPQGGHADENGEEGRCQGSGQDSRPERKAE